MSGTKSELQNYMRIYRACTVGIHDFMDVVVHVFEHLMNIFEFLELIVSVVVEVFKREDAPLETGKLRFNIDKNLECGLRRHR